MTIKVGSFARALGFLSSAVRSNASVFSDGGNFKSNLTFIFLIIASVTISAFRRRFGMCLYSYLVVIAKF